MAGFAVWRPAYRPRDGRYTGQHERTPEDAGSLLPCGKRRVLFVICGRDLLQPAPGAGYGL